MPADFIEISGCRWIEGESTPLRHGLFCGKPTLPGQSWCAAHRARVYVQRVRRAQAAVDRDRAAAE